jgi:hypothetical protein
MAWALIKRGGGRPGHAGKEGIAATSLGGRHGEEDGR